MLFSLDILILSRFEVTNKYNIYSKIRNKLSLNIANNDTFFYNFFSANS